MTDYYEPKSLRGAIRKAIPPRTFLRTRFFPEDVFFPTETVSFEYQGAKRRLAPYTSPYAGGESVSREGYEVRTYHTPSLVPKRVITNDSVAQKLLGESPYNSGMTPEDRAAEMAARDLMELQDMIARREEQMCAEVLQSGKLLIKGRGVNEECDYGFTGVEVIAAGDKWVSGYDIPGKLASVAQGLRKAGTNPDTLILGSDAANALMDNTKFTKLLDLRRVDSGEIKPSDLESGVQYIGRIALPGIIADIYGYDEWYDDEASGQLKPLLDPKSAILISSRDRNMMLYGAVTYIEVKTGEYVTEMSKYVPYTNYRVDPPVKEIYLASRPLPMPKDLESWHVMSGVV